MHSDGLGRVQCLSCPLYHRLLTNDRRHTRARVCDSNDYKAFLIVDARLCTCLFNVDALKPRECVRHRKRAAGETVQRAQARTYMCTRRRSEDCTYNAYSNSRNGQGWIRYLELTNVDAETTKLRPHWKRRR